MPSLEQIHARIETIDGLRDIIHSMRALAATYLRRSQERLTAVRNYRTTVVGALRRALQMTGTALPPVPDRAERTVLVIFSEQGFCGRFNEVMADAAERETAADVPVRFLAVGRKGPPLLRRRNLTVFRALDATTSPDGVSLVIHRIAQTVTDLLAAGTCRDLHLLHARYLSPGRIEPHRTRVLPLDRELFTPTAEERRRQPPLTDAAGPELLDRLVGEFTFISLFRALTESLAGENGMRLQSMEAARENIDQTLGRLRQQARQQRQNEITEELLDVVAGAEALGREEERRDAPA
jgi:F-type H+-transporting ATPase subunit gamma